MKLLKFYLGLDKMLAVTNDLLQMLNGQTNAIILVKIFAKISWIIYEIFDVFLCFPDDSLCHRYLTLHIVPRNCQYNSIECTLHRLPRCNFHVSTLVM